MSLFRDDAWRPCSARRARASATPAPVGGPLASGVAAVVIAVAVAYLTGLSAPAVAAIAFVVGVGAAVAARRTLVSLVAGAGMRLARPYHPGEPVRLYVPSLRSVVDAEVVRVGPANTTLMVAGDGGGLVVVANSRMLRAGPEETSMQA